MLDDNSRIQLLEIFKREMEVKIPEIQKNCENLAKSVTFSLTDIRSLSNALISYKNATETKLSDIELRLRTLSEKLEFLKLTFQDSFKPKEKTNWLALLKDLVKRKHE